ncbi:hypothetical protein DH2020_009086 [Rehmannia glutinosa]|uniref:Uncharacterized protein n=1 Tax=Rehmannia glutinosa TaxID=99300 RepID=A0ABR0X599_REHGL
MSSSSPSPQPLQQEQTHESDVVCEDSLPLNQETPIQPDPLPKSDPGNTHPPQPIVDPGENSPDEEDDDEDGEEIEEGQEHETLASMPLRLDPPITDLHVSVRDVTLASPSNTRRGANKRKKGKGKGKGYPKQQQAIDEKLQTLMAKLNPIPFIPNKILDFAKHENLLKKLGLWDFVHIDFDRRIRVDLIAELIVTYKAAKRASYVNGIRIPVSRADLARAFKLPLKKKGNVSGMEMDLESEALSDDSIGFIIEFVSDWVLLHEDMWMMPNEVTDWLKVIKDGHPEKVDWASLFWFMVEKELKQGGQLKDCYYASHLQHLMKFQREDVFVEENTLVEAVKSKEDDYEDVNEGDVKDCLMEGPSTELTLGQDSEKEEETKDLEMMDVENCKDSDDEEEEKEEEQGQWLLHGKNNLGEHFMQRCGDGFTGNLLQSMEANQMAFTSQDNSSSVDIRVDMPHITSVPSFFNNSGKRVIEHDDNHISHHSNDGNKKLRINDSWENKPVDFVTCMDQIQQVSERARMFYEEKEQALEQSNMNQQILLTELQKRDAVIEHLHKSRLEEMQKKDGEIYRLERELYLMGSVTEGYRKALKETQRAFAEYREKAQLPEEPTYKDAGPGGLMLTAAEIEKLRKKREEEYKMNCLIVEQKMKEAEEDFASRFFNECVEKLNIFDKRLTGVEADAKELIELCAKRKTRETEEAVPEVSETPQVPVTEEEVPENAEPQSIPKEEGKVSEVEENQPNE